MTTSRARIEAALIETRRYIAKESARAEELRPTASPELLAKYVAHEAKLVAIEADLVARLETAE